MTQWGTVHALNAGILASTGDVVIVIDEDVTMPPLVGKTGDALRKK